jgi:hypothetical protein
VSKDVSKAVSGLAMPDSDDIKEVAIDVDDDPILDVVSSMDQNLDQLQKDISELNFVKTRPIKDLGFNLNSIENIITNQSLKRKKGKITWIKC